MFARLSIPRVPCLVLGGGALLMGSISLWWMLSMPRPDEVLMVDLASSTGRTRMQVDVFLPAGQDADTKHPTLVLLHGVEGAARHARQHYSTARMLNRRGYAVYFVHYFGGMPYEDLWHLDEAGQLDTRAIHELCVADSRSWTAAVVGAIRMIALRPDVDTQRIGIHGYSLGGFVALAAAERLEADDELPDAAAVVVNWGAMFDGTRFATGFPPCFFVHGGQDHIVSLNSARQTVAAIRASAGEASLFIVPKPGHAVSSVESTESTLNFLSRHLGRRPAEFEQWIGPPAVEVVDLWTMVR